MTDGRTLDVELSGLGTRTQMNWQSIVDQATGCNTAAVVTEDGDAAGVRRALAESRKFLGGGAPDGLLLDNKACNKAAELRNELDEAATMLVPATLGPPESKAVQEGAFSLSEDQVGSIRLDDSSKEALIHSAVGEVVRAYTAATNAVTRIELGGMSRLAVVRSARSSIAQQAADRAFIRAPKEHRERQRHWTWQERIKPASRRLLGHVFARLELEALDPNGKLQEYLSICEPVAILQAAAVESVRLERGELQRAYADRYLTKVIQSMQVELDLWCQGTELLELCRLEAQDWVSMALAEYEEPRRQCEPKTLACSLAERAASGDMPVEGAFWTEKLLQFLESAQHLVEPVRRFHVRLTETPLERRIFLLGRIAAYQRGIV